MMPRTILWTTVLCFAAISVQLAVPYQPIPIVSRIRVSRRVGTVLTTLKSKRNGVNNEPPTPLHRRDDVRSSSSSTIPSSRRALLLSTIVTTTATLSLSPPKIASALDKPPPNPLNLKGTFWETGKLYVKENDELPSDPSDLLDEFRTTILALDELSSYASSPDCDFSTLSKKIRGGVVSESKLRTRGNALLDLMDDDDEGRKVYGAREAFRVFLIRLDALDRAVLAARGVGGVVETIGVAVISPLTAYNEAVGSMGGGGGIAGDARLSVLVAIDAAEDALKAFVKKVQ